MRIVYVQGIPQALFDKFVDQRALKSGEAVIAVTRWNKDIAQSIKKSEQISEYSFTGSIRALADLGYQRAPQLGSEGEFSVRGDLISFWPPGMQDPVRMEFFGDDLEGIYSYDLLTGRKIRVFRSFICLDLNSMDSRADWNNISYIQPAGAERLAVSPEILAWTPIIDEDELYLESTPHEVEAYDITTPQLYFGRFDLLKKDIEAFENTGGSVHILSEHPDELADQGFGSYVTRKLNIAPFGVLERIPMGFYHGSAGKLVLTDREIFGTIFVSRRKTKLKSSEAQRLLAELEGEIEIGDFVVHEDYGVGIYQGLTQEDDLDYLKLSYAQEDELFVPLEQIEKLTKYIGDGDPQVTRLGKIDWENLRGKIKAQVAIAAKELARHYAQASLASAMQVMKEDSEEYKSFIAKFDYELTADQASAERDVIASMASKKPMSRLLIGDVGFGKTEIMMRAAFKVVEAGGQVVILCPTTVLSLQHFKNFRRRFADYGAKVELASRFRSSAENKLTLEKLASGECDVLIGTHRLLSNDIKPKKLGLLIIDEEQRFGVKQKEKIRQLEYGVHNLYVSATPIPRTLSMALSSIQEISLIQTPPPGRMAVVTKVAKLDWGLLEKAVRFELERGGQIFIVHNEIKTIHSIASKVSQLLPSVKMAVAHGQMSPQKLDEIMTKFYEGETQILLSTTIVENGLDLPTVNTIIVNNSQRLGLAQMHQLRGRVGRGSVQAYAYFFYQGRDLLAESQLRNSAIQDGDGKLLKIKEAKYIDRLEAILAADTLGAGFKVASRDLEIRGAGNLLGAEQHGNISKIGYGLYMQMLAEEIEKLKSGEVSTAS